MTLSADEYETIIADVTKSIVGDIAWEGRLDAPGRQFLVNVDSASDHPIFVKGWYNAHAGKLSYALIDRRVGRIHGLDLGADHRNPNGESVGQKHKNYWVPGDRDKWAYVPDDIAEPWHRPAAVWAEFCAEINLRHTGAMQDPGATRGAPLI